MAIEHTIRSIGVARSPYKEKFAIPRQPGLVTVACGTIELDNDLLAAEMVEGLEDFSHIWVLFLFHENLEQGWKPRVKPPRLGGNKKLGVLATRSTFRPNGMGMSVLELNKVSIDGDKVKLHVSGLDLLDNTPIIDIKPYIQYADALPHASSAYAAEAPAAPLEVSFSDEANTALSTEPVDAKLLIKQVLAQDPRPAYKRNKADDKIYGVKLFDFDVKWQLTSLTEVQVLSIERIKDAAEPKTR